MSIFPIDTDGKRPELRPSRRLDASRDDGARKHNGVDVDADKGEVVWAPVSGVASQTSWDKDKGYKAIVIRGDEETWFVAPAVLGVPFNSRVLAGQPVGVVIGYGDPDDPHVHVERWRGSMTGADRYALVKSGDIMRRMEPTGGGVAYRQGSTSTSTSTSNSTSNSNSNSSSNSNSNSSSGGALALLLAVLFVVILFLVGYMERDTDFGGAFGDDPGGPERPPKGGGKGRGAATPLGAARKAYKASHGKMPNPRWSLARVRAET